MALRPFLIKTRDNILQAPQLRVTFREVHHPTGKTYGGLTEVEHAGYDKSKLSIRPVGLGEVGEPNRIPVVRGGGGTSQGVSVIAERNSRAVKKFVRRITDDDATLIATIDNRIADLEAQTRTLRLIRKEAVESAWLRGKEIPMHELAPEGGEVSRKVIA